MAGRGRPKALVMVSDEDRVVLERWSKRPKTPMSVAQRARIVLLAADGLNNRRRRGGGGRADAGGDPDRRHAVVDP